MGLISFKSWIKIRSMKLFANMLIFLITIQNAETCAAGQIERIWLTYRTNAPESIVINWQTNEPSDSRVKYRADKKAENTIYIDEKVTLHHVEIPIDRKNAIYRYSVHSGQMRSGEYTFKTIPADQFRVAVIADWQRKPALDAILNDDPHLLLTAGDNISNIWKKAGEGNKQSASAYSDLIDAYPDLFRSIPFMPVLGNHDKEIRPRGPKPPDIAVYDINATAFQDFFELPGDEWKWHFDIPEFNIRFVALDLNHIADMGTTWQACHRFDRSSQQFRWYKSIIESSGQEFIVTLYNEKNSTVRGLEDSAWRRMLEKGTICISGYGYFAEKAVIGDFVYYNTSLNGKGDVYPDPDSDLLISENSYITLTIENNPSKMTVRLKNLAGRTLDTMVFE